MSRYAIFVIDKNGPPLPQTALMELADVGCQMAADGHPEMVIDFTGICGKVTTEFAYGCIHAIHGMVFTADVFSRAGQIKLRFLIPVFDLVPRELQEQWRMCNELLLAEADDDPRHYN